MFFPHPSRHRPSVVSRWKTLLGLSHRLYLPSKSCGPCLTERQSPDLIIASRNGLRAISLWAAAWATTTLLHIVVRKMTGQTAIDFVVSSSSMLLCTVHYSQDLVAATFVGSFKQSLLIAYGDDWV